ncbi:ABC transporter permease [Pullulanibacillus sp. KACC 23026]|uniref:ABC transporter permease subunit n=1 Tax=Pullulanibacillus sp. KACC 23026 TaxID=3028315 RepID=UPI0023B0853C|nr:ABC transporter permease [Pullulanibacillus sp. KACC 23026]WEG11550.1 ABC transporter permease [Pullulanibacillus sp. KACC 23026]
MNAFIRLVQNENMKLYKRKLLWIMVAILIVTLVLSLVVTLKTTSGKSNDWKAETNSQIKKDQEAMDSNQFKPLNDQYKNEIKIDQYRLKNDVPPLNANTSLGFVQSTLGFSTLLTIFIIIIASSIVSQEFSWGTIKLVTMRPIQRWKILLSKYVSVLFNALVLYLLLIILSFLLGVIVFGFGDMSTHYVYIQNSDVRDVSILTHFVQYFGSNFIGVVMIATFAFMLSTLFKSNALAIALSIIIQYAGSLITNLLSSFDQNYVKYVFFTNTDLYQYVEGTPPVQGMTLSFSLFILLAYFVVFIGLSIVVFQKRDIV